MSPFAYSKGAGGHDVVGSIEKSGRSMSLLAASRREGSACRHLPTRAHGWIIVRELDLFRRGTLVDLLSRSGWKNDYDLPHRGVDSLHMATIDPGDAEQDIFSLALDHSHT